MGLMKAWQAVSSRSPGQARKGSRSFWSLTDFLAVLGGADLCILQKAKSTKPSFVGLGLVMVATAAVATMSMGFALTGPLKAPPVVAVPLAICWGAIILIIDRYLVKSMQGIRAKRTILAMAVPRVVMAAVIGVVVSTPITLRIFEPEIAAQVSANNLKKQEEDGLLVNKTAEAKKLDEVNAQINKLESIKNGNIEPPETPGLKDARAALTAAESARDKIQSEASDVYLKRACEEAGAGQLPQCKGLSSSESGRGPRWKQLNERYNELTAQLSSANERVSDAQSKVDQERADAVEAAQTTIEQQKKDAQRQLCGSEAMDTCEGGLMKERAELESKVAADLDKNGDANRNNQGIHAQLTALGQISTAKENRTGGVVHAAMMLFFFLIEIMPVTVKTLVALGNDHQYDDVADRMKQAELVAARSQYDTESLRASNQEQKRVAIENDMVQREIALGKLANQHVQNEMETILKSALEKWSKDLKSAMAKNPPKQGQTQQSQSSNAGDPNNLGAKQGRI